MINPNESEKWKWSSSRYDTNRPTPRHGLTYTNKYKHVSQYDEVYMY